MVYLGFVIEHVPNEATFVGQGKLAEFEPPRLSAIFRTRLVPMADPTALEGTGRIVQLTMFGLVVLPIVPGAPPTLVARVPAYSYTN